MSTNLKHKLFLLVFCLASIAQGMYSTYFVSILTILERIYQIQSKTAGAIISATEIGHCLGSLFIAHYGGRGNKPKWMSICVTLSAVAALISISPHFIQMASDKSRNLDIHREPIPDDISTTSFHQTGDLRIEKQVSSNQSLLGKGSNLPARLQLCLIENDHLTDSPTDSNGTLAAKTASTRTEKSKVAPPLSTTLVIAIFSSCLLVIGFGSTAITTLGIPFIDDIISREESPLYLGLTIALRIFGPALGFILGSFCIRLNLNPLLPEQIGLDHASDNQPGSWWLGLVIISIPLLILAIPMYFLSKTLSIDDNEDEDYGDITYQAAEDHDIGGSHDFPVHLMGLSGDLDVPPERAFLPAELDGRMLQICPGSSNQFRQMDNYKQNISFDQPILSEDSINKSKSQVSLMHLEGNTSDIFESPSDQNITSQWAAPNVCLVVSYSGTTEPISCIQDESRNDQSLEPPPARASTTSTISYTENGKKARKRQKSAQDKPTISDLASSLSRLLQNRLLVLRMLSGILHILPIAGFYTFLPKYLMEQFGVTSSNASVISGLAGILFVGFGTFFGGTIIRVFNVNSKMMTRWIAASALFYSIGMIILMNISCDRNQLVHFNSSGNVSSSCSSMCNCTPDSYNPVCFGGTSFASPCLAGCKSHNISSEGKILYDGCGCSNMANATMSGQSVQPVVLPDQATEGRCSSNCDSIVWYVILFSIFTLIHSSCEVGSMMFNLRCVKPDDRTLALGLITFSSSLLGTIPCSVIYGSIADFTCIIWDRYGTGAEQLGGNNHGACMAYDNDSFRYNLHGLTAAVMALAFIVDCVISRESSEIDFYDQAGDESKMDIRIGLKKSTETIQ